MFTGIVEQLGSVATLEWIGTAAVLTVELAPAMVRDGRHGDSYAINGVCLTATDFQVHEGRATVRFDVMGQTLNGSALGGLAPGDPVNVERPLRLADRLGGHLVQGHVDGVGIVRGREPHENWDLVRISLPAGLERYVVMKGSITVDGTSLTVAALDGDEFTVALIPETLQRTTLGARKDGDLVNLEVDVLAKYVERLMVPPEPA